MQKVWASIIIPVRNGAAYIEESINSCLAQESKYSFEVIAINDHSRDKTFAILKQLEFQNSNLRVLDNEHEPGVGSSLNLGLSVARGDLIIRIDSDDKMSTGRLDFQVKFMKLNPNIALVGGQILPFGRNIELPEVNKYPNANNEIIKALAAGNAFADPTTCFRREHALLLGGFATDLDGAEQYDFWLRLSILGEFANSDVVLTEYRIHDGQFTRGKRMKVISKTIKVQIRWILGITQFQTKKLVGAKYLGVQTNLSVSRFLMTKGLMNFLAVTVKHFIRQVLAK